MHTFKKKFGQNFLRSSKYAHKIIELADITGNETIVEIGPGDGYLTKFLIETNAQVISIEVDYSLVTQLVKKYSAHDNFTLKHHDVLDIDFDKLLKDLDNIIFTGSLPYNISKKIIKKCTDYSLSTNNTVKSMIFIVQEEVAKQYNAQAPEATQLSSLFSQYLDISKSLSIPASQFYPRPKVNGAILKLIPKNNAEKNSELEKLIKIAFSSPRKTLANNLKASQKYSVESISSAFNILSLRPKLRASELYAATWPKLFRSLQSA